MGILDILSVWWYLNRYAFSNVQNEFHIGIVVVVGPSWHRHVMICHFDVLCERHKHRTYFSPNNHAAFASTIFLAVFRIIEDYIWTHCKRASEHKLSSNSYRVKAHLHWPSGPLG